MGIFVCCVVIWCLWFWYWLWWWGCGVGLWCWRYGVGVKMMGYMYVNITQFTLFYGENVGRIV